VGSLDGIALRIVLLRLVIAPDATTVREVHPNG
jgi:hypothetical protein